MCDECAKKFNKINGMKKPTFKKGALERVAKQVGGVVVGFGASAALTAYGPDFLSKNKIIVGPAKVAGGGYLAVTMDEPFINGLGIGIAAQGAFDTVAGINDMMTKEKDGTAKKAADGTDKKAMIPEYLLAFSPVKAATTGIGDAGDVVIPIVNGIDDDNDDDNASVEGLLDEPGIEGNASGNGNEVEL